MNHTRAAQMPASSVTSRHLGQTITATCRATGITTTGGLSDVAHDPDRGHTWLWAGGTSIELRSTDTVTVGDLPVLGGAA